MKTSKKMFVILAIVFFVGFAGGMLTEHVIHLVQAKKSVNTAAEKHGGHSGHCADGHMDAACAGP